ncbi:MAG TPA: transporter substrate-binding domain-containing protein, partial [Chthonomonadaceae bacterium]|nr:transporter substrate-binding domain-containing protein [Chthonomonadaceae bacterium]
MRKQGIYAGFVLILMPFMAGCKPSQNALERVRQKGELVIITDPTYPPFEFNEGEKLIGFDVDLAREIGKELGVRVHFIVSDWDGVLPSLHIGKA